MEVNKITRVGDGSGKLSSRKEEVSVLGGSFQYIWNLPWIKIALLKNSFGDLDVNFIKTWGEMTRTKMMKTIAMMVKVTQSDNEIQSWHL